MARCSARSPSAGPYRSTISHQMSLLCDRVDVVRDLDGLDRATEDTVARLAGR